MTDTQALRERRDTAVAAVSRLATECEELKGIPLDRILASTVRRKLADQEELIKEYRIVCNRLTSLKVKESDSAKAVADDEVVITTVLTHLNNRLAVSTIIHTLELMLGDVERAITKHGYDTTLENEMSEIERALTSMRIMRAQPGALTCPELRALSEQVTDRYRELQKLQDLPKPADTAEKPTISINTNQGLPLDIPKFDGTYFSWKRWWKTFSAVMKENSHLTDYSKQCHFLKAMDTVECKEYALKIFGLQDEYGDAIQEMRDHYEDCRMLHRHYHQAYYITERVDLNRKSLQGFTDRFKATNRALTQCKVLTSGQSMIMHALTQFSPQLLQQWKKHTRKTKFTPQYAVMEAFLDDQIECLGAEEMTEKRSSPTASKKVNAKVSTHLTTLQARSEGTTSQCPLCQGSHYVAFFPQYQEKTPEERQEYVRSAHLCFNCLGASHRLSDCRNEKRCKTCSRKHHTSIHVDRAENAMLEAPLLETQTNRVDPCTGGIPPRLIKTALVSAQAEGVRQKVRAQFDGGSTVSLITTQLARTLKAPGIPNTAARLSGINGSRQPVYSKRGVRVTLIGVKGERIEVCPQVIDEITPTPTRLDLSKLRKLTFLEGLPLADPQYASLARIDLLIDVETSNACHTEAVRSGPYPGLKAYHTIFGWTLSGGETLQFSDVEEIGTTLRISPEADAVQIFRDLIALEDDDGDSPLTRDEQSAMKHFVDHVRRDSQGRYYVSLPRRHPLIKLGRSHDTAFRRFLNNERSLLAREEWESFSTAVDDYFECGHSEEVPEEDLRKPVDETYYLPMHGVKKAASTSTKLRVVFDASAKTSNGKSLNDTLLPGPALHPFLPSVITSFRSFEIAFSGDISKMFRGIGLNPEEYDYHRYVHRRPDQTMKEMRHKRLTFGVTSSLFLANQVVRQISVDYSDKYPLASQLVRTNYYVDDCLAGANSVEEAYQIVMQSVDMLKEACLDLTKWRSNSQELLELIPERMRESSDLNIPSSPADCSKALGLHWGPRKDELYVAIPTISEDELATRRRVASAIARIYDALGFFSPFILHARVILQSTWDLHLDWDGILPEDMQTEWRQWLRALPILANHPIPRYLGTKGKCTRSVQLHRFADASFTAYGGVAYIRIFHEDLSVTVSFVTSRMRLVPRKKKPTIPRLELCAALMLAQLMSRVQTELRVSPENSYYWSDSSVVLGWLHRPPGDLKAFVSNRVTKISDISDIRHWRHVQGDLNPADLLSRGVTASELVNSLRWWKGPPWLSLAPEEWPRRVDINKERELPELKGTALILRPAADEFGIQCSSFDELVRSVAQMRRFLHQKESRPPYITVPEYLDARRLLLRSSQRFVYDTEYELLSENKFLPKSSSLANLSPFLDKYEVMRVGGRLQKAGLSPTIAHPVILSVKSHVARLFIKHTHETLQHTGASTVMATLAMHYHIPSVKRFLRKLSKSCVRCRILSTHTAKQQMGELPEVRTRVARAFSVVGMDFAGPFRIKRGRIRDPTKLKSYVCLFICYVTKAVHLELVGDMTTDSFVGALQRFVGRRGCPDRIETDNGSNFIGAEAELQRAMEHLQAEENWERVEQWSTLKGIEWKFTPPRTPQFGGLWEAAVGAMKTVLRSTLGDLLLDFEEFATVLVEVEAIMNSRPLISLDSAADDAVEPLTAGHFLIGAPLTALPFYPDTQSSLTLLKRWNLVKRLQHELWSRWKQEYLIRLNKRHKDLRPSPSLKVGDVVVERNVDTHQRVWPIAVVVKVKPGTDNLVRVVDLRRTNGKIISRGVRNLVHLFSESDESDSDGGECSGQEMP